MNTQYLKYAIEVERTGSITQAADNLYIGQPSLSKAIRELEESLGIVIFKRTSKGAVPTEKGLEFLKYARAVMVQIEKMEMLYRPNHPDQQELFLSIPRSSYIAMAAVEFACGMDTQKDIEVEIRENEAQQVLDDVIRGETALGIVRFRTEDETYFEDYFRTHELQRETVWEFEKLVTLSRRHPLAERLQLRSEELFRFVEIVMKADGLPYVTARLEERRVDERPEKQVRVPERLNQLELCAGMPGAYMWSEPLADEILEKYSLVQHRCPNERGRYKDVLIYREEHEFTLIEKRFINKLFECRNRVAFRQ